MDSPATHRPPSIRSQALAALGIACVLATSFMLPSALVPCLRPGVDSLAVDLCKLVALGTGCAAAVALQGASGRRPSKRILALLSWVHPAGIVLFASMVGGLVEGAVVLAAAGIATGLGSLPLYVRWRNHLARFSPQSVLGIVGVGLGISAIVGLGAGQLPPLLLPALYGALAVVAVGLARPACDRTPTEAVPASPQPDVPVRAIPVWGLVLLSFVAQLLGQDTWLAGNYGAMTVGLLCAGILLVVVSRRTKRPLFYLLYQVVLPLGAIALIMLRALAAELLVLMAVFDAGYWALWGSVAGSALAFLAAYPPHPTASRVFGWFCAASAAGVAGGLGADHYGLAVELVGLVVWMGYFAALGAIPVLREWAEVEHESLSEPARVDAFEDAMRAVETSAGLSPREAQIFAYLARGHGASFIARSLLISESTVRTHMQNIYAKTGVSSREELIIAVEQVVQENRPSR